MRSRSRSARIALGASLAVHGLGLWSVVTFGGMKFAPSQTERLEIELDDRQPAWGTGASNAQQVAVATPLAVAPSAARSPRLDTDHVGSGQPGPVVLVANAASRLTDVTVSREVTNHPLLQQWQRLHHSQKRGSRRLHRTTPHPQELTLLTTGTGFVLERVSSATHTSEQHASQAATTPDVEAVAASQQLWLQQRDAPVAAADARNAPATRRSARMKTQRPGLERGAPAVPAELKARVTDRVDANLAVATRVAALVSASAARGAGGAGLGGTASAASRVGDTGTAWGERSQAASSAGGGGLAADPSSTGYYVYVRQTLGRLVQSAFPVQAKAEGRGGMAVFSFVIQPSGRITAIHLERASGIPEYDAALRLGMARIVLQSPPVTLGAVAMRMRFVGVNPAVSGPQRY